MRKVVIKRVTHGKNKGQFRFSLVGDNGEIVATSGSETYHNEKDILHTLDKYFSSFPMKLLPK